MALQMGGNILIRETLVSFSNVDKLMLQRLSTVPAVVDKAEEVLGAGAVCPLLMASTKVWDYSAFIQKGPALGEPLAPARSTSPLPLGDELRWDSTAEQWQKKSAVTHG